MPPMAGDEYESLVGAGARGGLLNPGLSPRRKFFAWLFVSCLVVAVVGLAIALGLALGGSFAAKLDDDSTDGRVPPSVTPAPPPSPTPTLADAMSIDRVVAHLAEFEKIARANSGSRAPQYGYNASLAYVKAQLSTHAPGFVLSEQYFQVQAYTQVDTPTLVATAPEAKVLIAGRDFLAMRGFAGSKTLNNTRVVAVPNGGCSLSDYDNFTQGQIALVVRGPCAFSTKTEMAGKGGAGSVLIYNDGTASDRYGPIQINAPSTIPGFMLAFWIGESWASSPLPVSVTLHMNEEARSITTMNLIADAPWGSKSDTILFGSHLDSVEAGPGINDDGSGSATNLELAIQFYKGAEQFNAVINHVRFCWWGAEELGLVGSRHYVETLNATDPAALKAIALNWNMDMLGSPNGVRGIHNGASAPLALRNASTKIQSLATDYLDGRELAWAPMGMGGGSDYLWFLNFGIPASGAATGAGGIKTDAERAKFGGLANTPYDPCYHQACDTVENVDRDLLLELGQTTATVLQRLASMTGLRSWLESSS